MFFFNVVHYCLQEEYWGSMDRYNRLLRVKQQWDPDHLFWCHHCVGSDLVTHQSKFPCTNPYTPPDRKAHLSGAGQNVPDWVVLLGLLFTWF